MAKKKKKAPAPAPSPASFRRGEERSMQELATFTPPAVQSPSAKELAAMGYRVTARKIWADGKQTWTFTA